MMFKSQSFYLFLRRCEGWWGRLGNLGKKILTVSTGNAQRGRYQRLEHCVNVTVNIKAF